jgi:hypothetical protein
MKIGDMIKMVTTVDFENRSGLVISIDRRHGVDCNRHSRVATVMTTMGELVTWPLDSHYQIEVVNENR